MTEPVTGPAAMKLWKEYSGQLAPLSLAMGTLGPALFATLLVLGAQGLAPWWLLSPVQVALAYGMFIAMHDAAHGSIGGSARLNWLDEVVGWLVAGVFLSSYSFFRWSHLQHHANVNHPEKDPDYWVAGPSLPIVFLRCMSVIPGYYLRLLRADRSVESSRRAQRNTVLGALPVLTLIVAYGVVAGPAALLALWVGPALLASGMLGYIFDYLPHHPHGAQDRFGNARFAPASWRERPIVYALTLGQTHHPIHHLFPSVPWYRYRSLYLRIRSELAERQVPGA